ncbi:unnamed protein product [Durusdinium trenchii]|uniref:Uncharacterized protein n=1 Tax=Durusdinium trenchii TaxID=1381693 RepID=A0ABP0LU91_9DINO
MFMLFVFGNLMLVTSSTVNEEPEGSNMFFYGLVGSTAVIAILLWKFLVIVIGSLGNAMSSLMGQKNQAEKDTTTLTTTTASMAAALQEKINELTEVRDKDIIELQQKLKDTKAILEDRDIELHEVRRTMACEIDGRNKRNTALHRELEHSVKENEELKRVKRQNLCTFSQFKSIATKSFIEQLRPAELSLSASRRSDAAHEELEEAIETCDAENIHKSLVEACNNNVSDSELIFHAREMLDHLLSLRQQLLKAVESMDLQRLHVAVEESAQGHDGLPEKDLASALRILDELKAGELARLERHLKQAAEAEDFRALDYLLRRAEQNTHLCGLQVKELDLEQFQQLAQKHQEVVRAEHPTTTGESAIQLMPQCQKKSGVVTDTSEMAA